MPGLNMSRIIYLPRRIGPAFDSAVSAHAAGGCQWVGAFDRLCSTLRSQVIKSDPSTPQLLPRTSRRVRCYLYRFSGESEPPNRARTDAPMDRAQPWHRCAPRAGLATAEARHRSRSHGRQPIDCPMLCDQPLRMLPVGETGGAQDYARIYSDIRAAGRAVNPDFAMGGEFYAEPFLGLTDSGQDETNTGLDPSGSGRGGSRFHQSLLYSAVASCVPRLHVDVFDALLHRWPGCTLLPPWIGGPAGFRARGHPMIEADDGAPYQLNGFNTTLVQYLQRIVSLRTTYGYPFVVLGRMLRPPQPTVPAYTVPPATQIPYTLWQSASRSQDPCRPE